MYGQTGLFMSNEKRFQRGLIFSCHLQHADSANSSVKFKLYCQICPSFSFCLMFLGQGTSCTLLNGSASVAVTLFKLPFLKNNVTSVNGCEQDRGALKAKYQS